MFQNVKVSEVCKYSFGKLGSPQISIVQDITIAKIRTGCSVPNSNTR